jgi:hypothetical protein
MAGPDGKFFIGDKLKEVAPHHESFEVSLCRNTRSRNYTG